MRDPDHEQQQNETYPKSSSQSHSLKKKAIQKPRKQSMRMKWNLIFTSSKASEEGREPEGDSSAFSVP